MFQKIKNIYHLVVAICANVFYGFPAKKLTVVGVTGTDGKTTTATIINHILKENKKKVSMLTSLSAEIDGEKYDTGFHVTTPSPFALQKLLKKAVDSGSEFFVLEVTSHAIDQHRIWGVPFKTSVLTNISNEHLDYHKTFENYANTKFRLFQMSEDSVLNLDDTSYSFFKKENKLNKLKNVVTYGEIKAADVNSTNTKINNASLQKGFNMRNALAAVACSISLGLNKKDVVVSLDNYILPEGRFEYVYRKDFSVLVDFAHTPKAFSELFDLLKTKNSGKIIHVFGSAGERDQEKRPELGKISSKYSDVIILTAEDPRSEDAKKIIKDIRSGVSDSSVEILEIVDRKEAINKAIKLAKKDDLVLLTGKSHEKTMTYDGKEVPWNESEIVKTALKNEKN